MKNFEEFMKIKKIKAGELAVKQFTLPWDSIEDNENIRSKKFVKVKIQGSNNYITIKNIGHSTDIEDTSIEYDYMVFNKDNYNLKNFCVQEFSYFIIFVKEYNAYYRGDYTASWDGFIEDRECGQDYIVFKLYTVNKDLNVPEVSFKKEAKKLMDEWITNN